MVPRRFFFPPHYSFTRASSRRIASLFSPRFFFSFRSIFHQESDRVRHLSRLLAPASDYDDPSTTTVSSFGFDLWITDNRIRRTCSSCPPLPSSPYPAPRWSIATSATLCTPPFNGSHPVFLSFFSFFLRGCHVVPQIFSSFRSRFLSFHLLSSGVSNDSNFRELLEFLLLDRSIPSSSRDHRPWIHSRVVETALNRGLSSRIKSSPADRCSPSNWNRHYCATIRPRFKPLFFAGSSAGD